MPVSSLRSLARLAGRSRMAAGQHAVDRGVENGDIAVHADRVRRRLTLKSIQPTLSIGIGFGKRDVGMEAGACAQEDARPDRKDTRQRLQSLDRSNLVTCPDAGPNRNVEVELDDIPEHPRRELRQANAPDSRRLFKEPVV